MINDLISLANELDRLALHSQADDIDFIIKKISSSQCDSIYQKYEESFRKADALKREIGVRLCEESNNDTSRCKGLVRDYKAEKERFEKLKAQWEQCSSEASAKPGKCIDAYNRYNAVQKRHNDISNKHDQCMQEHAGKSSFYSACRETQAEHDRSWKDLCEALSHARSRCGCRGLDASNDCVKTMRWQGVQVTLPSMGDCPTSATGI